MKENIAIDESLMKFKGRMFYIQFNPLKKTKFERKFYKLCESTSGYCYDFTIYSGNDKTNLGYSACESVGIELSKSILYKGHTLYIGNWYSSPKLFLILVKNWTNVVGTVCFNRKNMPKDFAKAKFKKGECRIGSCNDILALKWKDKRDIHIISYLYEGTKL